MKTFFRLLRLLLLIIICSCDKEEFTNANTIENNFEVSKTADNNQRPETEAERFENKMQWVAYLTDQLLLKSNASKQQFKDALANSNTPDVIKLEDLLGSRVINRSFIEDFEEEFNYYQYLSENKCDKIRMPSGRPKPPPKPLNNNAAAPQQSEFELYISFLLDDDCLEFYMPNGFEDNLNVRIPFIISSAHPLEDTTSNQGFIHYKRCDVDPEVINSDSKGNIIIVRPYRKRNICTYREYSDIDFRDFLSN